jgi:hypothetical protein
LTAVKENAKQFSHNARRRIKFAEMNDNAEHFNHLFFPRRIENGISICLAIIDATKADGCSLKVNATRMGDAPHPWATFPQ